MNVPSIRINDYGTPVPVDSLLRPLAMLHSARNLEFDGDGDSAIHTPHPVLEPLDIHLANYQSYEDNPPSDYWQQHRSQEGLVDSPFSTASDDIHSNPSPQFMGSTLEPLSQLNESLPNDATNGMHGLLIHSPNSPSSNLSLSPHDRRGVRTFRGPWDDIQTNEDDPFVDHQSPVSYDNGQLYHRLITRPSEVFLGHRYSPSAPSLGTTFSNASDSNLPNETLPVGDLSAPWDGFSLPLSGGDPSLVYYHGDQTVAFPGAYHLPPQASPPKRAYATAPPTPASSVRPSNDEWFIQTTESNHFGIPTSCSSSTSALSEDPLTPLTPASASSPAIDPSLTWKNTSPHVPSSPSNAAGGGINTSPHVASPRTVGSARMRDASRKRRMRGSVYRCPMPGCPADFTAKHNLLNHERSHRGERPHKCDYCDMRFTTQGVLKRHLKTCGTMRR